MKTSTKPILKARVGEGEQSREITLPGRFAWTFAELLKAGKRGVTPIERPAPRWSHYVWRLRHDWGLAIETINEPHSGPFAGTHARYVMHTPAEILEGGT